VIAEPAESDSVSITDSGSPTLRKLLSPRISVTFAATLLPPVLYFVYIGHYGVDVLTADDWTVVPLVNAAIVHHLTWHLLWSQYTDNRFLFPKLVFIFFGKFDHLDAKTIMYFSALLFSAAYFFLLFVYRDYAGRFLGILPTFLTGLVWFSLSEFENSLWAFQVAWFMVDFSLLFLLFILSRRARSYLTISAALLVAIMASYSLLQGLILWPVGLLCLLWREQDRWRTAAQCSVWIIAAAVTTAFYVRGFDFSSTATGGSSIGFAIRHPIALGEYMMAAAGNVFPSAWPPSHASIIVREGLGSALLAIGALVFYLSCRERPRGRLVPLPAALVLFAVLFDVTIAVGRSSAGAFQALSFRYTMGNLLLLIGVALFGWSRLLAPIRTADRHITSNNVRLARLVIPAILVVVLIAQIFQATDVGLRSSQAAEASREAGARTLLDLSKLPQSQAEVLVAQYVYPPGLSAVAPFVALARRDELSIFAPGASRPYRHDNPPGS